DFVPHAAEIKTTYEAGSNKLVSMHDGSLIKLNKLQADWDPTNRDSAVHALHEANSKGEILTGLIYINEESQDLHQLLNTSKKPLNTLSEKQLCPGPEALMDINQGLR
ncbi:MAG: 2-oxoacid:ferredoxin oxidoreductase subunit beta, partial [Candidatus Hydrogenedentes bacterium]|nr:2-oxoacid:ferredoxin oxidoreductase subunit beta [Candidatus Hydrogenedentota bacterium]